MVFFLGIAMDISQKIAKSAYLKNPFEVALDVVLGAYLCRRLDDGTVLVGKITELEVYVGAEDKACHAYLNRKTKRNAVMFDEGGVAYVFFVYGMYHQFNVVVGSQNEANALLIRSLEPVCGIEKMKEFRHCDKILNLTTGPGKLCQALHIDRNLNAADLLGEKIWLSPRDETFEYVAVPRVGIDYAEEYKDKPWRYYIKNCKFISKK